VVSGRHPHLVWTLCTKSRFTRTCLCKAHIYGRDLTTHIILDKWTLSKHSGQSLTRDMDRNLDLCMRAGSFTKFRNSPPAAVPAQTASQFPLMAWSEHPAIRVLELPACLCYTVFSGYEAEKVLTGLPGDNIDILNASGCAR